MKTKHKYAQDQKQSNEVKNTYKICINMFQNKVQVIML